mmetsp:Transcript_85321/g.151162  ORF Transcript_85321/g.151162 Transcript_85321/m.151162 type:complete len:118 (+) Transcript_85321:78-431(+)
MGKAGKRRGHKQRGGTVGSVVGKRIGKKKLTRTQKRNLKVEAHKEAIGAATASKAKPEDPALASFAERRAHFEATSKSPGKVSPKVAAAPSPKMVAKSSPKLKPKKSPESQDVTMSS